MNFWRWLFKYSDGGMIPQTSSEPPEDHSVRFRIVPIPRGRWALEKMYWQFYRHIGLRKEWRTIGEYDTAEAAQADYRHIFCTPEVSVEAGKP